MTDFIPMIEAISEIARERFAIKPGTYFLFDRAQPYMEGEEAFWAHDHDTFVRKLETVAVQVGLSENRIALWKGVDKQYRLINLNPILSPLQLTEHLYFKPPLGPICAYCKIDEHKSPTELSIDRKTGTYLHPRCQEGMRSWARTRGEAA